MTLKGRGFGVDDEHGDYSGSGGYGYGERLRYGDANGDSPMNTWEWYDGEGMLRLIGFCETVMPLNLCHYLII